MRFLSELKHKVYLFKIVRGFFHVQFCLVLSKFIFLLNKKHILFDLWKSKTGVTGSNPRVLSSNRRLAR